MNNEYETAHKNADTDISKSSIHHTIGVGPNQAASGAVVSSMGKELKSRTGNYTPGKDQLLLPTNYFIGAGVPLVDKVLQFIPFDVKGEFIVDRVSFRLRTARIGGPVTLQTALYGSTDEGYPDLSNKIVESATDDLSTGADRHMSMPDTTLVTGRYWLASLYLETSVPSTAPTIDGISSGIPIGMDQSWLWFNGAVNNPPLHYDAGGQTSFPVGPIPLSFKRANTRFFALRRKA